MSRHVSVTLTRAGLAALCTVAAGAALVQVARPVVTAVAVAAAVGTGLIGAVLIRLSLRIHANRHDFGPCRGAGFLGLGVLISTATALAAGIAGLATAHHLVAPITAAGSFAAIPAYVLGLLLLPGAAPTRIARLRRTLDGSGVGASVFFTFWLLAGLPVGPTPALVLLAASVAVAVAVVTGLRAARFRTAALSCAGGAALSIAGLAVLAVGGTGPAAWITAATALLIGPGLIADGAQRAGDGPEPAAVDEPAGLAGQPLLAVPVAAAAVTGVYHAIMAGPFDPVAVTAGVIGVSTIAVRETLAAIDVRRYASALRDQESRLRALVAGSTDVITVLDPDLRVRWQSPAAARQFGLSDADVLGRPLTDLLHPEDADRVARWLGAVLAGTAGVDTRLVRARLRDGFGRWRETESAVSDQRSTPAVGGLVVHVRDIGDRARLQRSLEQVTWTDQLTGLGNRRRLVQAAGRLLARAEAGGALISVDLRGFADVTAVHGPAAGDAVLVEVGRRLRAAAGPTAVAVRLSAGDFAVVTDLDPVRAYALATRLLTVLGQPYELPNRSVHMVADVGVADLTGGGPEEVLHRAELAARRARQLGHCRVECYDESFVEALRRRVVIETELPGLTGRGQLVLVYQPIIDLESGWPLGAEALLRWRHQELGWIAPPELISVAESAGRDGELFTWVLNQACRQLSRWGRDGRDLWLSINVSGRQLAAPTLLTEVAAALASHAVPAGRLVVEVAEADLPGDAMIGESDAAERLAGLRALGVRTALDRFGAGPTTLVHLRRLPVDMLKVDRAVFTEPGGSGGAATPIVDVVVALGERLGIEVIALGLGDAEDVDLVRAAGCRAGQGFALAAPTHAEHLEAFLDQHRTPRL